MDPQQTFSSSLNTETRYRLLVDAVTDYAIYMLDPNGIVVSWNSGAQRLKGYTESEIVGQHFSRFYPEQDIRAGSPARTLETASRENRFEAEGWRVRKNGDRFWAHVVVDAIRSPSGELLGYAKVTRDLSERRVAEESLRRSEEQFRLLVQSVTDYAIYMLDPTGVVTSWNAGAERIKGYRPGEVIGTHFSRFYEADDRTAGLPTHALEIAARDGRFESEGWRLRKDGTRFWANVVVDPIRNDAGDIIGFAKITRDVTEKRNTQLELERAREALFQSQKLDAIGQLTGGVAHDFNNLLMVILSSLELVRRRVATDEKLARLIDNAVKGAKRGVSLTQRMLAFARRQELKPVAVDVGALVHGMRDMLERTLGPSIHIDEAVPGTLGAALVDANQLELALLNLAVNARDAMPEGGRLTISGRTEAVSATQTGLAPGRYICLAVADTGAGMSEETLSRAMEPFFTTKGAGKGTGLGLPMVQGLAGQSGGHFILHSTVGAGTTAELWLPMATTLPAAADAAASVPARRRSGDQPPLIIAAVDDDGLVLAGTVAMLEDLGHTVLTAASGLEALELLRREPAVELLVTDQAMPGMTGTELIEILRGERPDLRAILATGFGELSGPVSAAVLKLAKPFDQNDLSDAIANVLASRGPSGMFRQTQ